MSVSDKVRDALINAGSTFSEGLKQKYREAIEKETHPNAKWALEQLLENAALAEINRVPLCDDTGIPHLLLEIGKNRSISGDLLAEIQSGIEQGLSSLPGRPMSNDGSDVQRLEQSGGLNSNPAAVIPAPLQVIAVDDDNVLRLHILMLGGGPSIRGKTYRVYHKNSIEVLVNEIVSWSSEAVKMLGCTPATLAVGIGRSHYEASSFAIEAQIYGDYGIQNEIEEEITDRVNELNVGALGLGGDVSVLATFMKVGPQRASGVRIVSVHPCCCMEPRKASVDL